MIINILQQPKLCFGAKYGICTSSHGLKQVGSVHIIPSASLQNQIGNLCDSHGLKQVGPVHFIIFSPFISPPPLPPLYVNCSFSSPQNAQFPCFWAKYLGHLHRKTRQDKEYQCNAGDFEKMQSRRFGQNAGIARQFGQNRNVHKFLQNSFEWIYVVVISEWPGR